jgi:hypothetical protein
VDITKNLLLPHQANPTMKRTLIASLILATSTVLALTTTPAEAATFKFKNIFPTNSNSELSGDPFVDDFSFDVTDAGSGKVRFQISNAANNGSIGSVYFENTGSLLSNMLVNVGNVGNVKFKNSSPGNLPQGNKINFNEVFAAKFNGGGSKRIDAGESLGITFNGNFSNVISALQTEDIRVGIHVQELPCDQSDSFVSYGGTAVPEPISILGSGAALGFGVLFKKKSVAGKKKQK